MYSMVLFSIVLSFFCVLIFYFFNKRLSVSPKPGMVYLKIEIFPYSKNCQSSSNDYMSWCPGPQTEVRMHCWPVTVYS